MNNLPEREASGEPTVQTLRFHIDNSITPKAKRRKPCYGTVSLNTVPCPDAPPDKVVP